MSQYKFGIKFYVSDTYTSQMLTRMVIFILALLICQYRMALILGNKAVFQNILYYKLTMTANFMLF